MLLRLLGISMLFAAATLAQPNIILINADDLGVMDVGYHSDRYRTPNINSLCAEGMVFSESFAAAANCAPSRACVMSGQYTPRHGIYTVGSSERGPSKFRKIVPIENKEVLPDENLTIAEALKAAGYRTIHLGKWHLGADPTTQGFDINIGGDHSGTPAGGYFVPFGKGSMKPYNDKYKKGTHRADIFADEAIRLMKENKSQPFFMYMAYYSVHSKLEPVPEFVKNYDPSMVNATYASMIEKMDQSVGRILEAVEDLGLKENTLVVFTSDNGGIRDVSSQAPYRSGKGSYFDGGIRVPLVIRWPGHTTPASLCETPVIGIDFYPTFLEVAGVPVPKGKLLDGVSIVPLLKKGGTIPERPLFWHFPIYLQKYAGIEDDSHDEHFRTRPGSVVRLGKWKLHEYFEDGRLELYDLAADPAERVNLAAIHAEKAQRMHQLLKEWRKETDAPVPTELNPEYNP